MNYGTVKYHHIHIGKLIAIEQTTNVSEKHINTIIIILVCQNKGHSDTT